MTGKPDSGESRGWLVHDVVIGALAGASAGMVIGLFALARVESGLLAGVAILTGAIAGVGFLRWERNRRVGPGIVTGLAYVVMILSIGFVAAVILAIRNFT